MTRLTWALYLIGAALVFGAYLGLVPPGLAWIGWAVATGIALNSWFQGLRRSSGAADGLRPRTQPVPPDEAARREVYGEDAPPEEGL
jgi:hypothetical protein